MAAWLWRGVELVALRVAVGSWRNAGLAMFWLPVIAELDAGNVHLILAAAVAMAIRGDGRAVLPAALTKFASVAALPRAATRDLNGAVVGAILTAAICLVSLVLVAPLWIDYLSFIGQVPVLDSGWYDLGAGIPLAFRMAFAGLLALAAVRWARLAAVATTLALPVLWFHGLSVLVAGVARPAAPASAMKQTR